MELVGEVHYGFHTMLEGIQNKYSYFLESGDPRTEHLFGVKAPWFTISVIGSYLLFVTKIGPWLMKNREPFQFRKTLIVYNFLVVLLNLYLAFKLYTTGWKRYSILCEPAVYSTTPEELLVIQASYLYFISKFVELLDTIFFVLRKKNRQLSFLHLFHHSIMPINVYCGMKWMSTGHVTFFGLLNSLIHVPMYVYYMLTAVGPSMQKYLWWKKHLTTMQLIQFVLVFFHSISGIFGKCDTRAVNPLLYALVLNSSFFMLLFSNFYFTNYLNKSKVIKERKSDEKITQDGIHPSNGYIANGNGFCKQEERTVTKEILDGDSPSKNLRSRTVRLNGIH